MPNGIAQQMQEEGVAKANAFLTANWKARRLSEAELKHHALREPLAVLGKPTFSRNRQSIAYTSSSIINFRTLSRKFLLADTPQASPHGRMSSLTAISV